MIRAWIWMWCAATLVAATAVWAQAQQQQQPPPAPERPRPPTRHLPYRGTAPAPTGADTLDVHSILKARSAALDSALQAETTTFDTLGLDSLVTAIDRGGAAAVDTLRARRNVSRRRLRVSLQPGALSTYDRVNGLRLGSGVELGIGRHFAVEGQGSYSFASEDWGGAARARAGGTRTWIEAGWADHTVPFGPNQGGHLTSIAALVAGQDRQEYLLRRRWDAGVVLHPLRRTRLGLSYGVQQDFSALAATDFHFFGSGTPIENPNPSVDTGFVRELELDATWRTRAEGVALRVRGAVAGGELGGDFEHAWQEGALALTSPIFAGGTWHLDLGAANVAGSPPVQVVPYLGGDGNLRGYAPLEFAGRRRATVRAEYAYATDLLARTGIPIVRTLHLQFIPFADAGTTWGEARGVAGSRALDGHWRSSLGLGIQRDFYYPGIGAVRLDVSRRTDGGPGGVSVWFRILPFFEP